MKRFLSIFSIVLLLTGAFAISAFAETAQTPAIAVNNKTKQSNAPIPTDTTTKNIDGKQYTIKTFETAPNQDPSQLKEESFELDGYLYDYHDMTKEEIPLDEKKIETKVVTVSTAENDANDILLHLAPDIDYNENGFTGKLVLQHQSIDTKVEDYTTKSYTISDTQTISGLSSNDSSNIAKTIVKNGVTLKLQSVDWSVQQADTIDYSEVPSMYTATAVYTGEYSKQVPTSYLTKALYTGEVAKSKIQKVIYTVTYSGREIPEIEDTIIPETNSNDSEDGDSIDNVDQTEVIANADDHEITEVIKITETSNIPKIPVEIPIKIPYIWIIAGGLCLIAVIGAVMALLISRNNIKIYLKEDEDYRLVARRFIKPTHPVVDLGEMELRGKEIAVCVKKATANKLFGRQICTVAKDGFSIRCIVDKQDCDFWYMITIPEKRAEKADSEEVVTEKDKDKGMALPIVIEEKVVEK